MFLPALAPNLDFHTCSLESAMHFKGGIEQTIQFLKQETCNRFYLRVVFAAKTKSNQRKTGGQNAVQSTIESTRRVSERIGGNR